MVYECLWYNLSFHGALWKPPFTSLGPVSGLNSVDLFMAMFQVSFSICPSIFFWLVVTGTMEFWMTFHILGIVTPTDELIFFQDGYCTTNQPRMFAFRGMTLPVNLLTAGEQPWRAEECPSCSTSEASGSVLTTWLVFQFLDGHWSIFIGIYNIQIRYILLYILYIYIYCIHIYIYIHHKKVPVLEGWPYTRQDVLTMAHDHQCGWIHGFEPWPCGNFEWQSFGTHGRNGTYNIPSGKLT